MSKRSKRSSGFADPTRLAPFDADAKDLTVIIEMPKGSRNKYAYDPKERIFELRKVLPAGIPRHRISVGGRAVPLPMRMRSSVTLLPGRAFSIDGTLVIYSRGVRAAFADEYF